MKVFLIIIFVALAAFSVRQTIMLKSVSDSRRLLKDKMALLKKENDEYSSVLKRKENKIVQLNSEVEQLASSSKKLERLYSEASKNNKYLKEQVESKNQEIGRLYDDIRQSDIFGTDSGDNNTNIQLKNKFRELISEREKLYAEIKRLNDQKNSSSDQASADEQRLITMHTKLQKLNSYLEKAKTEIDNARKKLEQKDKVIADLKSENETLVSGAKKLRAAYEKLKQQ